MRIYKNLSGWDMGPKSMVEVRQKYRGLTATQDQRRPERALTHDQQSERLHCVNIEWDTPSLEFSVEFEGEEEQHHDTFRVLFYPKSLHVGRVARGHY